MFAGNAEHDAHEFCLELLNQMHDELLAEQKKANGATRREEADRAPHSDLRFHVLRNIAMLHVQLSTRKS
jgi:ubiquitin C-terminal hydrolase